MGICGQSSVKGLLFNSVTERVLRLPNQSCSRLTPFPPPCSPGEGSPLVRFPNVSGNLAGPLRLCLTSVILSITALSEYRLLQNQSLHISCNISFMQKPCSRKFKYQTILIQRNSIVVHWKERKAPNKRKDVIALPNCLLSLQMVSWRSCHEEDSSDRQSTTHGRLSFE